MTAPKSWINNSKLLNWIATSSLNTTTEIFKSVKKLQSKYNNTLVTQVGAAPTAPKPNLFWVQEWLNARNRLAYYINVSNEEKNSKAQKTVSKSFWTNILIKQKHKCELFKLLMNIW